MKELEMGHKSFIGVDEAGRGCLAGPVVAAAVFVNKRDFIQENIIEGLKDSKKISRKKREEFCKKICLKHLYAVSFIYNEKIDKINILNASLLAMENSVQKIKQNPDIVIVDGVYKLKNYKGAQLSEKSADNNFYCVSAASIVAKVIRDQYMESLENKFPNFSFSKHKGYGTKHHYIELEQNGPSLVHRRSFRLS